MRDQHKKIKGYRDLTQSEIDAMNSVKDLGEKIGLLIEEMKDNKDLDKRWILIAETNLQQGIMAAVRAIAKPESF